MPNITLTVPAAVLRAAKIRAAEQGTSVSGLVREFLVSLDGKDRELAERRRRQEDLWAELDAGPAVVVSTPGWLTREEMYDPEVRRQEREELRRLAQRDERG